MAVLILLLCWCLGIWLWYDWPSRRLYPLWSFTYCQCYNLGFFYFLGFLAEFNGCGLPSMKCFFDSHWCNHLLFWAETVSFYWNLTINIWDWLEEGYDIFHRRKESKFCPQDLHRLVRMEHRLWSATKLELRLRNYDVRTEGKISSPIWFPDRYGIFKNSLHDFIQNIFKSIFLIYYKII